MSYHPIAKTEAVVLRVTPFSNTSHIVTWLTPGFGKLATVIKGACRPKRAAAGEYDLGWRCELLFYEYGHNGLHTFKECAALDRRAACRADWRRTAVLSYLCHLAGVATPDGAHVPALYRLTETSLETLSQTPPPHDTLVLWFELRLLELLGLSPRLEHCTGCRQRLAPAEDVRFPAAMGGAVCERCAASRSGTAAALRLGGGIRRLMIRWQRSTSFAPLRAVALEPAVREPLCRSLRHFVPHYLEIAPESRAVAFQMAMLQLKSSPVRRNE